MNPNLDNLLSDSPGCAEHNLTSALMKTGCVGGSFSARVPRSSAEVRSVFIHDIMEVEGVGQQEQQGDQRDDKERR